MTNYWGIPRLWPDKTFFILGGGPTLPMTLADRAILNCPVIGVNNAFSLGSWVGILFFGDARWYWWNEVALQSYNGIIISTNRNPVSKRESVDGVPRVKIIRYSNSRGICTKPGKIHFNSSSGAAAVNLAWHLGAKRIVLVGFDMHRVDGKANWMPHPIPKTDKPYTKFIRPFYSIAKDAKCLGLEILNATPNSELTMFPTVQFEDVWKS